MPPAEVEIDELLVRTLVRRQFPEFAHLEIRFLDRGWDNENYRLGERFIVRLPRRAFSVPLLNNEINCLQHLPPNLPIGLPRPVGVGKPGQNYPWHWSIIPWFEGTNASYHLPKASEAGRLVAFLKILHAAEKTDFAPENPHRSEPLLLRDEAVRVRMERLKTKSDLISPKIEALWQQAIETPPATQRHLVHGDLHSGNIIIFEDKINAIIDWGDITTGDVAVDLACLWMLFPEKKCRQHALESYGASPDLIRRAIGWAVYYAVVLLDTGWDGNPEHAHVGAALFRCLAEE